MDLLGKGSSLWRYWCVPVTTKYDAAVIDHSPLDVIPPCPVPVASREILLMEVTCGPHQQSAQVGRVSIDLDILTYLSLPNHSPNFIYN